MTPKEKAEEILLSYKYILNDARIAKRCALIAVEEMLHELDHIAYDDNDYGEWKMKYWQEVKQEIEKL